MDARLKDLILQCLNIKPEDRPTAEVIIKHAFIVQHLPHLSESSSQSCSATIHQPKVTNLPVQVYTPKAIDTIVEKLVDRMFDRHSFDQDLRVEQIWEEPNRRHLAIALGVDYTDLVSFQVFICDTMTFCNYLSFVR